MRKKISVALIFEECGLPALVEACARNGSPVGEMAILSWLKNGIPEKHWQSVMEVCDLSPVDLHEANEALRRARSAERRERGRRDYRKGVQR
jgi:hypothetical protein